MTRACEEQSIVDQAIENSDTATRSMNECHVSQSDTIPFHFHQLEMIISC
jgi:hypothetical protein